VQCLIFHALSSHVTIALHGGNPNFNLRGFHHATSDGEVGAVVIALTDEHDMLLGLDVDPPEIVTEETIKGYGKINKEVKKKVNNSSFMS
jgi:hypothetical protein